MSWNFYGRAEPLHELKRILAAGHWFFCRIEGRRRIGKTSLLRELAREDRNLSARLVYCQIPDSDERDVAVTFQRALLSSEWNIATALAPTVRDFPTLARAIGEICRAGGVVVLDEFQYFTRASLQPFNSHLQNEVDQLRDIQPSQGGLFVLGSLQAEMTAILEDRGAPLYGRITHTMHLDHWDFADLQQMFQDQLVRLPSQWLTLWTFFEGVPKFYNDAYEQGLLALSGDNFATELLTRMFLKGSSPLTEEADTWFLRELRGKAMSILHYLADHPGCANGELSAALIDPGGQATLASYLNTLVTRYRLIDRRQPVFSTVKSRNARFYIADNFLQAWLGVAKPARESARIQPIAKVLPLALARLETLEGFSLEKLIRQLHVEASRKGVGDFELSSIQMGYWNRSRDVARSIEIDLVALNESAKCIRFGSCKRNEGAHTRASLDEFDKHIAAFLTAREHRRLDVWTREKVLFAPAFSSTRRPLLEAAGYLCRDLGDFVAMFQSA